MMKLLLFFFIGEIVPTKLFLGNFGLTVRRYPGSKMACPVNFTNETGSAKGW